jgi:hypothetical protein
LLAPEILLVLLLDAPITIKEVMAGQSTSLADIFRFVLDYLSERSDAVLFGSHAVNAYVEPPRMTADVDIMSTDAEELAYQLRDRLADEFHMAVRVRIVAHGQGFRVYQIRKAPSTNRHLVDVRQVARLPASQRMEGVQVVAPVDLVVLKLASFAARRNTDKGISDRLDLHRMILEFPEFRSPTSAVTKKLHEVAPELLGVWEEILSEPIKHSDDDEY